MLAGLFTPGLGYCLRIIHKLSALSLEVVIMEAQDQAADNLVQFRLLYT